MFYQFSKWLQNVPWVMEINTSNGGSIFVAVFHYFGFFMIVGPMVIVCLRILGATRIRLTASDLVQQLFPMMWVGLVLATLTGLTIAAGSATMYYDNDIFYLKLGVVLLGVICAVVIKRNVANWEQAPRMPAVAIVVAALSLVLWIGTVLLGAEVPALTGVG